MGNDHMHPFVMGYDIFGGDGYGINRSGWKQVSDGAYRRLDEAKEQFHDLLKSHSFDGVADKNYKFTKKHAIKIHLVTKLRPQFNKYVARFDAKVKWVKLTDEEKRAIAKFKTRVSAVYFADITFCRTSKDKLLEEEPAVFRNEMLMTEIALFTCLRSKGVPEIDAVGWILPIKDPKEKVAQIPKIENLAQFLDEKVSAFGPQVAVEKTDEFKEPPKEKKSKKVLSTNKKLLCTKKGASVLRSITTAAINTNTNTNMNANVSKSTTSTSTSSSSLNKKSPAKKTPKKRTRSFVYSMDDEDEWTPAESKKRRLG